MEVHKSIYETEVVTLQGVKTTLEQYRGRVFLVVNTASKCGYTPQYAGLEQLHRTYRDRGFAVLGFPCNQFARQEPGGKESIEQTCYNDYLVSFPMFEKVSVNGRNTHPLFALLKDRLQGKFGKRITWNFTKFLIDAQGYPVKRYAPAFKPKDIAGDIEKLLG